MNPPPPPLPEDSICGKRIYCILFCLFRQQYEFDDSTTPISTATLARRNEIASTSISETRKVTSTKKVDFQKYSHPQEFICLFVKENKSIRTQTKRTTRVTQKRPPCTDMSITPESPNKMTTRSQVRSNNSSLNGSIETEIGSKRERQRKSQTNQRTPGLFLMIE